MITLIFLICLNVQPNPSIKKERVDRIEFNHKYEEDGSLRYSQYIFWEWNPEYKRYDVIAWVMADNDKVKEQKIDGFIYIRWYDSNSKAERVIKSSIFDETVTTKDPEREHKKLLDEKYRIGFIK